MEGSNSNQINYLPTNVIFITGGTKSGKSEFAEYLAQKSKNITYIALSDKRQNDIEWDNKISIHKQRRPKHWELVETTDLIRTLNLEFGPLLIDSIGGFVMENIDKEQSIWKKKMDSLLILLKKRKNLTLIVGEQVGWSLVSEYEVGNKYIERTGEIQKLITKISSENWLAINGRAIKLDDISVEIPS